MNLYPVKVVARAFEYSFATMFLISIFCGSDLSYLVIYVVYFVHFLPNQYCVTNKF